MPPGQTCVSAKKAPRSDSQRNFFPEYSLCSCTNCSRSHLFEEEFRLRHGDAVLPAQNEKCQLINSDDLKDVVEKQGTDNNGSVQIPL